METMWEGVVNKGSHFADFLRFRPYTYTRIQQSLPPLWATINDFAVCKHCSGTLLLVEDVSHSFGN